MGSVSSLDFSVENVAASDDSEKSATVGNVVGVACLLQKKRTYYPWSGVDIAV